MVECRRYPAVPNPFLCLCRRIKHQLQVTPNVFSDLKSFFNLKIKIAEINRGLENIALDGLYLVISLGP
jgi:hypothetical protein